MRGDLLRRAAALGAAAAVTAALAPVDPALRAETSYAPAWSPDGKRLSFEAKIDGRFAIVTMNPDGTGLRRVSAGSGDDFASSWSPDGRRIAFTSNRDGNREVYVMDADGSGLLRLTHDAAEDRWPRWSPDGQWIGFVSDRGGRREVHLVRPDGAEVRPLTAGRLDLDGRIAWAPAGTHLLVRGTERGGLRDESTPAFFYSVAVPGGEERRLADVPRRDYNAVWAPDGSRIAFDAHRDGGWESDDGGWEVFTAKPDGSDRRNLTRNAVNDWGPAWSPDGRQIAYCSGMDNRYEIHVMDADGSNQRPLTQLLGPRPAR